jgi:hypothetical protein
MTAARCGISSSTQRARRRSMLLRFLGAGKGKLQGGGAHGKRLSAGKKFWASRLGAGGSASMGKKAPALAVLGG